MKSTEKERLEKQTEKRYLWLRFKNGCKSLKGSKARQYALIAFCVLVTLIWVCNKERFSLEDVELVSPAFVALSKLTLPITLIGGTAAILILYGTPIGTGKITNELRRIGLTNSAGETPILTANAKDERQSEVTVFEFDGVGIPLTEWENKRQRIEAALNVHIVKLKEAKTNALFCSMPSLQAISFQAVLNGTTVILLRTVPHLFSVKALWVRLR